METNNKTTTINTSTVLTQNYHAVPPHSSLFPPSPKLEDLESKYQPWQYVYESAASRSSRMIIEASSYQTTPSATPPPPLPSLPADDLKKPDLSGGRPELVVTSAVAGPKDEDIGGPQCPVPVHPLLNGLRKQRNGRFNLVVQRDGEGAQEKKLRRGEGEEVQGSGLGSDGGSPDSQDHGTKST